MHTVPDGQQRPDQGRQIGTVSVQIHRQRQLLAAGEDGAAVISHRPADQQPIAGPDAMHAQIPARRYHP